MARTIGLSDTQRTYFEIVISMIGAAQMFIISNAIIADTPVDPSALWILALVVAIIAPLKAYLGIRDSSTAGFAKKANEIDQSLELRQFRKLDEDQVIRKTPSGPGPSSASPPPPPSPPPSPPSLPSSALEPSPSSPAAS
jgi:hypothetical protein